MKKLLLILLCLPLLFSSCEEGTPTPAVVLAIGDTYQGGIIFYLDGDGGGLIAATSDIGNGAKWGCFETSISGADEKAIGTGAQNTIDIEAGCTTSGTAADICANYTSEGYSDWFLPSIYELKEMYLNIGQGSTLGNIGGFSNVYHWEIVNHYWSSTENDDDSALYYSFEAGGGIGYWDKYYVRFVRAIRVF
jgi:hypothetical protein